MSNKVATARKTKLQPKGRTKKCSICKAEVAVIRITVEGNDLLMESCDTCDKRRWQLAGKSIDLEDALTEVGEHAGRGR